MYYNDEDRPTGGSKAHIPTGGSKACTNCGGSWWDKMKRELMNGQRKYLGYYTYGATKEQMCFAACEGDRNCANRCKEGGGFTMPKPRPSTTPECKGVKHFRYWLTGDCCYFC